MAGEAHPVPSRTRKLSPRAPMVLRGKPVGEQDVADQRRAFSRPGCVPGAHMDRPPSQRGLRRGRRGRGQPRRPGDLGHAALGRGEMCAVRTLDYSASCINDCRCGADYHFQNVISKRRIWAKSSWNKILCRVRVAHTSFGIILITHKM